MPIFRKCVQFKIQSKNLFFWTKIYIFCSKVRVFLWICSEQPYISLFIHILIARPKIDEGHKSLQYGSNDPRIAESQQVRPGPMRGMDFDRG